MNNEKPLPGDSQPSYDGPEPLRDGIFSALKRVVDPEMALSILDVGLIYGVAVEANNVKVRMTMTSPACPVIDVIVGDVEDELDKILPQDYTIAVEVSWEPPWDASRMSPRARVTMGW